MTAATPSVLIVGAGSIGRRHALNLMKLGARVSVMDPDFDRARGIPDTEPLPYDAAIPRGYDGIVIASPTALHAGHLAAAVATGSRVLVEKPLATRAELVEALIAEHGSSVMVGYNLRLFDPVQQLLDRVDQGVAGVPLRVALWFGSFLPDWRPTVDYRQTYSARAELGGGILLDAIHELDLLVRILGPEVKVESAILARLGDLEIDVESYVHTVLRTEEGAVATVELDYLSRQYRRGVEIMGTEATLRLDWSSRTLSIASSDHSEVLETHASIDSSYEGEAAVFLDWIDGGPIPPCLGAEGLASLRIADAIRSRATELG